MLTKVAEMPMEGSWGFLLWAGLKSLDAYEWSPASPYGSNTHPPSGCSEAGNGMSVNQA